MGSSNKESKQAGSLPNMLPPKNKFVQPLVMVFLLTAFLVLLFVSYRALTAMFPEVYLGRQYAGVEEFSSLRINRLFILLTAIAAVTAAVMVSVKTKFATWLLLIWAIATPLLLIECYLMWWPKSDGVGTTLNHLIWIRKFTMGKDYYYEQANTMLRKNPFANAPCGGKKIIFNGDSFTYGDGIDSICQTLPEQVGIFLQPQFKGDMINLGVRGADPQSEAVNFQNYWNLSGIGKCHDSISVVWQLCYNDLEPAAQYFFKKERPAYKSNAFFDKTLAPVKDYSFISNVLYWKLSRQSADPGYADYLRTIYADSNIIHAMLTPIVQMAYYLNRPPSPLPFRLVVYPVLTDADLSDSLYRVLYAELDKTGLPYLKVGSIAEIRQLPIAERVVSLDNPHPSVKVNQIVGRYVAQMYEQPYRLLTTR